MSRSIDERVLGMYFDNQQFESGVSTSLSTLDKLKQSLNFKGAGKGLESIGDVTKKVDMSGLGRAVESVGVKFSALQVMGVTALSKITNSALDAGKRIASALTDPLIEGGKTRSQNIEQAKFQLEGLGVAWDDIKDDINYGVKDTAYGLDAAAKVAAQLTASGIETGEAMRTSLRGISGLAAMTGSSYEDIGRIFTTVAGNGRMFATELNSIGSRGVNAAATLGKYLGKTESEVREMVSHGEIDFATFAAAMDSAFGEHAKDANKLFSGAMSNVRAALSRIGADFATPAYDNIKNVFNALIPVIDTVHEKLSPLIADVSKAMEVIGNFAVSKIEGLNLDWMTPAIEGIENIFKNLLTVFQPIREAFSEVFSPITAEQVTSVAERFRDLTANFKMSETTANNLKSVFKGVFSILNIGIQVLKTLGSALLQILKFLTPLGSVVLRITAVVGNLIARFKEWLSTNNILHDGLSKLISGLQTSVKAIYNFIKQLYSLPQVQQALTSFKSKMLNVLSSIYAKLTGGISVFGDFIEKIKSMDSLSIEGLLNSVKSGINKYLSNIGGAIGNAKSTIVSNIKQLLGGIGGVTSQIGNVFGGIKEKISEFVAFIKDKLSSINIGNILTVAMGASLILFVKRLSDAIGSFRKIFDGIGKITDGISDVIENFAGIFESISGVFDAQAKKIKTEAIVNIAKAIAILVGSIALLTTLDSGKVWTSVGVLGVIAAGLIAFSAALGALGKLDFKGTSTKSLLAMTASILILSAAIKQLGKMDTEALLKGSGCVAALIVFLTIVSAIPKQSGAGKSILAMSAAILLITKAIEQISKLDPSGLDRGMECITKLMAIFIAIMHLSSYANSNVLGFGKGILAMSVGLLAISAAMKIIAGMSQGDLSKGLGCVTVLMAVFTGVMALSKFAGENAGKAGAGILGMTSAILVLSIAMKIIAGMKPKDLTKGLACVTVLMAIFTGVMALSKFAGANAAKAGVMLLAMSGAIMVLSVCMMLLSQLDSDGLKQAVAAIAVVEVCFALLIGVTKLAENCKGTLITLTVAIGILAASLGLLSMLDPGNLITASACLSGVIAMFALLVASTSLMKNATGTLLILGAIVAELGGILYLLSGLPIESTMGAAASLSILLLSLSAACAIIGKFGNIAPTALASVAAMTLIVAALGGILYLLSGLPVESTMGAAVSLSGLLLSLSAACAIIGKFGNIAPTALASVTVMTLIVAALGGILYLLSGLPVESTIANAASLSILLLSLSAACAILSAVGATGPAGFIGIGVLATLIAGIGALIVSIGALVQKFPVLENFLNTGIPILERIGNAIGSFFGNIVGGFLGGMSSGIAQVGTSLSEFMTNFQPFIEGAKNISPETVSKIKTISEAGKALVEFITSIPNIDGNTLITFSEHIKEFGKAIIDCTKKLSDIPADSVEKIKKTAEVGKVLAEFASEIPNDGGVASWFAGNNSLTTFAGHIKEFGKAIADCSNSLSGVTDDSIERIKKTAEAGKAVAEFASEIPNEGVSFASVFVGDNSLTTFAGHIKEFGKAIVDCANSLSDVSDDSIERIKKTAEVGKALAEFASEIPNEGVSFASVFVGDNSLTTFAGHIKEFGKAMVDCANSLGGVTDDSIEKFQNITEIGTSLVEMANSLPESDAYSSMESKFSQLSEGIKSFADSLPQALASLSETDIDDSGIEKINKLIGIGKSLAEFASIVHPVGIGSFTSFSGGNNLSRILNSIETFSKSIADFVNNTSDIDETAVTRIQQAVKVKQALASFASVFLGDNGDGVGVPTKFSGQQNSSTIFEDVKAFVIKIAEFVANTSDIDETAVTRIQQAVKVKQALAAFASISLGGSAAGKDAFVNLQESANITSLFENLKTLSEKIKDFVSDTSDIDESAVTRIQKLTEIIRSLAEFDGENIGDGGNLSDVAFGLDTLKNSLKDFIDGVSGLSTESLSGVIQSIKDSLSDLSKIDMSGMETVGKDMVANFISSVEGYAPQATEAGELVASAVLNGLRNKNSEIQTAGTDLANAAKSGVESQVSGFESVGANIASGVASGISGGQSSVINAAVEMATSALNAAKDALGIQSPSKVMRDEVGQYIVKGVAEGIKSDMSAEEAAEKKAQNIVDAFKKELDKIELTNNIAELTNKLWGLRNPNAGALEKSTKNLELMQSQVERQTQRIELATAEYQQTVKYLGESSEYAYEAQKKLLEEEIEFEELSASLLEAAQANIIDPIIEKNELYQNGIDLLEKEISLLEKRSDITETDKSVATLKMLNEQYKKQNEIAWNAGVAYREIAKIYGEDSPKALELYGTWREELAKWFELEDSIHKQMEGNTDLIQNAIKANVSILANSQYGSDIYEKAVKENAYLYSMLRDAQLADSEQWISLRDTFGRERGLAEELSEAIRVQQRYEKGSKERIEWDKKVYEIEKNIYDAQQQYIKDCEDLEKERADKRLEIEEKYEDKIKEVNDEYENALESRAQALYDAYGLFDEVDRDKSVKASSLMRNLQDQVAYFEDWNNEINKLAGRGLNEALIAELQEMGPSAYAEIKALNSMTDSQLSQYANLWSDKHELASDRATNELEDMRIKCDNEIQGLKDDMKQELVEMNADIDEQLGTLKTNFEKKVGIIRTDTVGEFREMDTEVKGILKQAGYNEVGQQMVDGLTEGVSEAKPRFVEEIIGLSSEAINALKEALGIHSPSKVFAVIGGYIGEGLIVGIGGCINAVEDTTESLGQSAIDTIGDTIGRIYKALDDNPDSNPTIRPVLDLTDVNEGLHYMDGAFAAQRSLRLGESFANKNQNEKYAQINDAIIGLRDSNLASNEKVADAIDGLKRDFSDLVDKVTRLQVVMDTGVLVGEITPEMDRSLGIRANMSRRGV